MWPLLLIAAAAALVQGAQYGDYGAVKMPAYGDYDIARDPPRDSPRDSPHDAPRDHLTDASPSQDYKDDLDKVTQKRLSKDYGSGNSWQKPSRKQYRRARDEEDYSDAQSRNRGSGDRRHRDDLERSVRDDIPRDTRARVKHKREQHDDDEFSIEKYIQGINENNLEVDARGRKSTEVIVRRKTRDRDLGKTEAPFKDDDFDEELRIGSNRPRSWVPKPSKEIEGPLADIPTDSEEFMPRSEGRDLDVLPIEEMRRQPLGPSRGRGMPDEMAGRRRLGSEDMAGRELGLGNSDEMAGRGRGGSGEQAGRGRGGLDEPPRLRPAQRARLDPGSGSESSDYEYYDLKRLQNKKPSYSRPEAREDDWEPSDVDELRRLENRRLMDSAKRRSSTTRHTRRSTTTTTRTTTKTITKTNATRTTTTTTTPTKTTVVTTSSEPTLTPGAGDELSLAEKSRLSILKKVGQKERQKGGPLTTKPPVLLQVTNNLPTVVLVEKTTSGDPWLRAREVQDESPENLSRVRALMRSKLVANAKDIRELAEDWDQMVCDYVDVGLLENKAVTFGTYITLDVMLFLTWIWLVF
ncbi:uncharacterized protein LOC128683236 [Plodia interpunctella]|uniref:uncharacterized protein LOC128683236 n=1 Tax=Plodia interpunctella TaxID=58824 RepID=UPI002367D511|nr:uncharacterized protein LOC128683236 [Plodia interpunctella]